MGEGRRGKAARRGAVNPPHHFAGDIKAIPRGSSHSAVSGPLQIPVAPTSPQRPRQTRPRPSSPPAPATATPNPGGRRTSADADTALHPLALPDRPGPTAALAATPDPANPKRVVLTWQVTGDSTGQVYVSVNTGADSLVASGPSGTQVLYPTTMAAGFSLPDGAATSDLRPRVAPSGAASSRMVG